MKPMKCREMLRHLSDYIDGTIDASVCEQFDSHLPDCKPCQIFIRNFRKTVAALKMQKPPKLSARLRNSLMLQLDRCKAASRRRRA